MALNLVTDMAVHDNMDGTVLLIATVLLFALYDRLVGIDRLKLG